jgi:hypothetical protein
MKPKLFSDAQTGTPELISESGIINANFFIEWLKRFTYCCKCTQDDPVLRFRAITSHTV